VVGDRVVEYERRGRDGLRRRTRSRVAQSPSALTSSSARFDVSLAPGARKRIELAIEPSSGDDRPAPSRHSIAARLAEVEGRGGAAPRRFRSSSALFDRVLRRTVLDLRLLDSRLGAENYYAAGIPWFATLFGRDSAIAAYETLPWEPETARDTLRLLARHQATEHDAFRDAAPGKILHELRRGELARCRAIPQSPAYYGSVDATPLFLILLCAYVRWSGDAELARELRPNAERALEWMAGDADSDGDGFLDYTGAYRNGLVNQGWKDSGDAIVNADGSPAKPPIALCEVQGYAYRAWRDVAGLWRALGSEEDARALEARAAALRDRFERSFWSDELGCYVLALQAAGRHAAVVSSNAGQVLWSGIARSERAAQVVDRMLARDSFSGWGVRTLSAHERAYNPMSYHRGSVWPHDNAMLIEGFRRYGHDEAALRIFDALFDAASSCRNDRLPELFCGFPRTERESAPVPYPVACNPQAWAAGALPYAVYTLLGLSADAARKRLVVRRPCLPERIDTLEVRGLRVGGTEVELSVERARGGTLELDWRVRGGDLEVVRA
jgi:glycogen debranching enzyme